MIIALRNEKGSYNINNAIFHRFFIIALRNEKGSYNTHYCELVLAANYSTAK